MARLSDLVNVDINLNKIKIQGVEIPVIFTFESFPYVEESYGKPYHEFEKEMNDMLAKGEFSLGEQEAKLMRSLIYAMVKVVEQSVHLLKLKMLFHFMIYLVFSK